MNKDLEEIANYYDKDTANICQELFPLILEHEGVLFSLLKNKLGRVDNLAQFIKVDILSFKNDIYYHYLREYCKDTVEGNQFTPEKQKELEKILALLDKRIKKLYFLMDKENDLEKKSLLHKKLDNYFMEYRNIRKSIKRKQMVLIRENDEIAVYRMGNDIVNKYYILEKGSLEEVGEIDYRGYGNNNYLGDIGYSIRHNYQGKHYAYKALCLLSDYLNELGIDSFIVTVHDNNIASIKTIERYQGKIINREDDVIYYQCDTRKIGLVKEK